MRIFFNILGWIFGAGFLYVFVGLNITLMGVSLLMGWNIFYGPKMMYILIWKVLVICIEGLF